MDNIYMKGELLRVVTVDAEVYEGRFEDMDLDKTKITLGAVKLPNRDTVDEMCHFFRPEVQTIIKLKAEDDLVDNMKQSLKISQKEYEDILKVYNKYIFINQVDHTYHEALDDLNLYGYIAVGTDGAEMGRKCKLPFMTLATPQQIYIFDIQVMQYHAFDGGLKQLLESEVPKKIVHDCRKLSDCLKHKHNVELKSVFDTQVGDIIISKNKTGLLPNRVNSLDDCLRLYLGLPPNTIVEKLDVVECSKRPLSTEIKETLARNIAYLHRLSEVIHEELLLPYVRGVDCYVNSIRSCDDFHAWDLCGKDKMPPKEFSNAIEY